MAAIGPAALTRRVLQRTGFGVRPAELAAVGGDPDRAVRSRLAAAAAAADDRGAAATPAPRFPPLPPRKVDGAVSPAYRQAVQGQRRQIVLWWLDRMVAVTAPWPEKRTLLWHGHWATSLVKVKDAGLMLGQYETLHRLGGGDFRALARAMVRDPALLLWLDAAGNTAAAPNENLARELMELFTLGVGRYTEQDVRAAARVLTGWRVDRAGRRAVFRSGKHAGGEQTILGQRGDFTDQSLADLLVAQPACAEHLVRRFWSWLVSGSPPPDGTVRRLVAAYGPGRDMTDLFTAMLTEPAFADPASVLVKQPVEYLVGLLRALDLQPAALPAAERRRLVADLDALGQVPFRPPSVGGWPTGSAWLTTTAARVRTRLAGRMAALADLSWLEGEARRARPDALADWLGIEAWTARTRSALDPAAGDPRRLAALGLCAPEYVVNG